MNKRKRLFEKDFYVPDMIYLRMGKSIELVPRLARLQVAKCISLLPGEVIDFTDKYVFIGQDRNELGSQFQFDHPYFLNKKGFILLSSQLWQRRPIEKAMVVAHEVAHAVNQDKFIRSKKNIIEKRLQMEEEANELAIKWLSKRYKKEKLLQICKWSY
jgi:hypothetical protein